MLILSFSEGRIEIEKDPIFTEKVQIIKRKMSGNASAMPLLANETLYVYNGQTGLV